MLFRGEDPRYQSRRKCELSIGDLRGENSRPTRTVELEPDSPSENGGAIGATTEADAGVVFPAGPVGRAMPNAASEARCSGVTLERVAKAAIMLVKSLDPAVAMIQIVETGGVTSRSKSFSASRGLAASVAIET